MTAYIAMAMAAATALMLWAAYRAGVRSGHARATAAQLDAEHDNTARVLHALTEMTDERQRTEHAVNAALAGGVPVGAAARELSDFAADDAAGHSPAT